MTDDEWPMVDQEPEVYNCQTCVVVDRLGALDHVNRCAWRVYGLLARRFVSDLALGPDVLRLLLSAEGVTPDQTPEEWLEMIDRLSIIHDVRQPSAAPPASDPE